MGKEGFMSEYTRVNFGALSTGQADFLAVYNALKGTLEDLDAELKGSLSQWEDSAKDAYHQAKAQWDQAAHHMAQTMNALGKVIGVAHKNYRDAEHHATRMW
jgi:WXG100 family type VII secretion target